jgi:hypothetical protein
MKLFSTIQCILRVKEEIKVSFVRFVPVTTYIIIIIMNINFYSECRLAS